MLLAANQVIVVEQCFDTPRKLLKIQYPSAIDQSSHNNRSGAMWIAKYIIDFLCQVLNVNSTPILLQCAFNTTIDCKIANANQYIFNALPCQVQFLDTIVLTKNNDNTLKLFEINVWQVYQVLCGK